ncbi:aminopeptidase N [Marinobacterium sp. LSUCC0821]|uniref:aminopeptidase N n=1 Tax=Marinobacterium sp. LSUCC0821 TaxID=2668067 RepID=UPI001451FF72|nr:aminopeptidase N [Marinobacterium sp. LSUCC0821]QJD70627.1 aminopeptidase N [Marinobacterium sp. LSUCC0821]
MSDQQPNTIYLKDYRVPDFLIDSVALRFELDEEETLVKATLSMRRNPESNLRNAPLVLHGDKSLELKRICMNGQAVPESEYRVTDDSLTIDVVPDSFELGTLVRIQPQLNTALEGLYKSGGAFCTQCEAEGFRRITYYLDRPDVMSLFTTTIVADPARYPVLLSNGNLIDVGVTEDGRKVVTWEDPFKKPAYLFALVAGDLSSITDTFTTASGRDVKLEIYADAKDHDKLSYAMDSLKRSMRWDEEVYGREYDLDIYMIVAVDFFNMGAMENKGLNIFNTSCVLASQKTSTDLAFQRVEAVVAHEYFHNWSGNRVTCRDWFQLSLKEGFTVFRDAEFSADMNSRTVKRIEDVALLRTAQFAEDAGPMSHAVRPESFIEISNFYTLTVYEKGAEVVRMIHTLLGAELFRKGTDLYFDRHDGQAVTTDDFLAAMEAASGRDLSQFKRWYSQAGTPVVHVNDSWDESQGVYTIHFKQSCPATPGQTEKLPFHMPIVYGLLDETGEELRNGLFELTESEQSLTFEGLTSRPVPSLLRGFSAPVKLRFDYSDAQLLLMMEHDTDGFNRWEAGQRYLMNKLQAGIAGEQVAPSDALISAWQSLMSDTSLDEAMLAKLLTLPTEAYLSEEASVIDVDAIHNTRRGFVQALGRALAPSWQAVYMRCQATEAYAPSAEQVARRSLKNLALSYLVAAEVDGAVELAQHQFNNADNMTDQQAALTILVHSSDKGAAADALASFRSQWQDEALVINNWLAIQAGDPTEGALDRVKALESDPLFDAKNPNKLRSLVGAFAGANPIQFHAMDGSGYRYLADWIITLNTQNPQIAARMLAPLTRWKRYPESRQVMMRAELERIMAVETLSPDVYEVVSKSLV